MVTRKVAQGRGAGVGGLHPLLPIMEPEPPSIFLTQSDRPLVTFGVEAASEPLRSWLAGIVQSLNGAAIWLHPGQDRVRYHAAATIASNYTVTLFAEAAQLLQSLDSTLDERIIRQAL